MLSRVSRSRHNGTLSGGHQGSCLTCPGIPLMCCSEWRETGAGFRTSKFTHSTEVQTKKGAQFSLSTSSGNKGKGRALGILRSQWSSSGIWLFSLNEQIACGHFTHRGPAGHRVHLCQVKVQLNHRLTSTSSPPPTPRFCTPMTAKYSIALSMPVEIKKGFSTFAISWTVSRTQLNAAVKRKKLHI